MLNYQQLANKPHLLRNFTGFTPKNFTELVPSCSRADENHLEIHDRLRKTPRQRQRGGGRKPTLKTPEDRLLFILLKIKFYPTQEALAF